MELQTDQATPEYSAAEGDKRAFNKFYANLLANHGVSCARLTQGRARGAKLSYVNLNFAAPLELRLFMELLELVDFGLHRCWFTASSWLVFRGVGVVSAAPAWPAVSLAGGPPVVVAGRFEFDLLNSDISSSSWLRLCYCGTG